MANEENLKPLSERTKSEQRKIAKKGGKASGAARAKGKTIREALKAVLSGKYEIDGEILNGYEALAIRAFKACEKVGGRAKAKYDNAVMRRVTPMGDEV